MRHIDPKTLPQVKWPLTPLQRQLADFLTWCERQRGTYEYHSWAECPLAQYYASQGRDLMRELGLVSARQTAKLREHRDGEFLAIVNDLAFDRPRNIGALAQRVRARLDRMCGD
jgi:hypothetical protein